MLASFWTGIGGKLADQWAAAILSPAFLFWGGGLAASGRLDDVAQEFGDLTGVEQGAAIIGAFLLVTVSGQVVMATTLPILRLLEGYWPSRLGRRLRQTRTDAHSRRLDDATKRWRELAVAGHRRTLDAAELAEYARLDRMRQDAPARAELRMPTRLGNVLRVAETRPGERYGLDAIVCWPRLWLVLPETARTEVSASRRVLDFRAEILVWAVLFCVWVVFAWWAPLAGLAVACGAYAAVIAAARVYGDLVLASYDAHRTALYDALRWPAPAQPEGEPEHGRALTRYLARGVAPPGLAFEPPPPGDAS